MKGAAMPASILIGYATRYGSTREVSEAIAETLRKAGAAVDPQPVRNVRTLEGYRAVVLGAPLFMYGWHADALQFLSKQSKALARMPVALFALGPTHSPHDPKEWADSRAQLGKALAKFGWLKPVALEMFGGKFDPKDLRFPLNKLAGPEPASDIRDWDAIRAWAGRIAPLLAG
jgi:menaquinone-dependent protoporphyrinogen oxidase